VVTFSHFVVHLRTSTLRQSSPVIGEVEAESGLGPRASVSAPPAPPRARTPPASALEEMVLETPPSSPKYFSKASAREPAVDTMGELHYLAWIQAKKQEFIFLSFFLPFSSCLRT